LSGLRTSAQARKSETIERLNRAIAALKAKRQAVTAQTIYAVSGLSYTSIARNPEALALFRANSTYLNQKQKPNKRRRNAGEAPAQARDPLMNYKKPQLVTRLRAAQEHVQRLEQQQALLLDTCLQSEVRVRELETKLAELEPYRGFVEEMRARIRREEQA
jgi:branched-subunit amino acid aminotransferase/4-amino-4-deoxychorismate lyase